MEAILSHLTCSWGFRREEAQWLYTLYHLAVAYIDIQHHRSWSSLVQIIACWLTAWWHYNDVLMSTNASQITSLTIVYSTVYSGADQRYHQSSAPLAFCVGNSLVTGEFPAQKASNAENVSIWWRHHGIEIISVLCLASKHAMMFQNRTGIGPK